MIWVGSSRKDLKEMPPAVQKEFGQALQEAQFGLKPLSAKPLTGFGGASVLEIVENFQTDAYRAVYTVRFADAVYVLHAFQKNSTRGIGTPQTQLNVIKERLKQDEQISRMRQSRPGETHG